MNQKIAIIIGAGPAGLTAAYELLKNTDIKPIIFEMDNTVGGLAKTVDYKGNKIDIGGHRFFSKSDRVIKWWLNILPLQKIEKKDGTIQYHGKSHNIKQDGNGPNPEKENNVMLLRKRKSRIYYQKKFFDYPINLNVNTLKKLGYGKSVKILFSYLKSLAFRIKPEKNLEDFFINRFGKELYFTFFKSYTEKVWGIECEKMSPEWGAQRIKGLSLGSSIKNYFRKSLGLIKNDIYQKKTETSLIEKFLYPKLGPGQLWEQVAKIIQEKGGEINLGYKFTKLMHTGNSISNATFMEQKAGKTITVSGDYFFSTIPIKELINGMDGEIPKDIVSIANGLCYRDFITVGLLVNKLNFDDISDNWIYIQESGSKVSRIQIFNNWSPFLINKKNTMWIGMEYICDRSDEFWKKSDEEIVKYASKELENIGLINIEEFLDGTVLRVKNAYPAYHGSYEHFGVIKKYLNEKKNLFLIGRNGMHKYNNQDHSMLTAMSAVENIVNDIDSKDNIWDINTEEDYHEKNNNT